MSSSRSKAKNNTSTVQGGVASLNKNKKAHGWTVLIFILGTLFPPLAVAARFGIGKDFWINLPLTIAGYIPGHVHNFYIQNIRNNKTHARTPKWAIRYGLVDSSKIRRNARRSEWANRYNDRDPNNDYDNLPVEDGQVPDAPRPPPKGPNERGPNGEAPLWGPEDEGYYNAEGRRGSGGNPNNASTPSFDSGSGRSSGRWHYPANFDDAVVPSSRSPSSGKKSKSGKKDRWARAEEARLDTGDDGGRRKKKSSRRSTVASRTSSYNEGPEPAVGGSYAGGSRSGGGGGDTGRANAGDENLNHEF